MSVRSIDPGPLSLCADTLQARLQQAFPPAFFQFEMLPARMSANEWERLVRRTPFIGLGWSGVGATDNGSAMFKGRSAWTVFAVVTNQSGDRGRYMGDAQGVGLFQVIQAAIVVLNGYKIPGLGTCMVTKAENAYAEGWNKQNIAIAAIDLEVNLTMDVKSTLEGPGTQPATIDQIAASWIFAPGTEVVISDVYNIGGSE